MDDSNLSFLLWIVDPRSPGEMRETVGGILRCSFAIQSADLPLEKRQNSFESKVFGFDVSLSLGYAWPSENAYCLVGGSDHDHCSVTGTDVLIDSHVKRTLEHGGLKQVMSRDEFGKYRRAVQASLSEEK
jgi:hypothetical protein